MKEDAANHEVRHLSQTCAHESKQKEREAKAVKAAALEASEQHKRKRRLGYLSGEDTPPNTEESSGDGGHGSDDDDEGVDARLSPHLVPPPRANSPRVQEEAPEQQPVTQE